MCRYHQIVIFDHEIVDRCYGKIQLQRLPMRAVIKRHEDAELSSCVKQTSALGIFAHSVYICAVGNSSCNCAPIFSEVGCLENVRFEIVELMPIHRYVSGVTVMRRSVDDADHAPL